MMDHGPGRYVALGDSFTEGVGDFSKRRPNGVRGWADRVAETLASDSPGWEYANLAIRSKRLRHIIAEQLEPAIKMEPTLITLYAGGNDVMDFGTKIADILAEYEFMVQRLAETGATLVLFTGYDVEVSPILGPLRRKNHAYNDGVRLIAAKYGAILVDYANFSAYATSRMWGPDRLHMSKAGHKYLAARVLDVLAVPHGITHKNKRTAELSVRQRAKEHRVWITEWVLPLFGRKLRGTTLGDALSPRWPEPVRVPPRKGLKKLTR
ncbi:SGNH/GDSL hydrolase family protein [Paeniglutamicibacter sp. Y32M11]|uniref:SGNH/GDSL hydrolase family protein n=1 Tax=Paeniglutamicibacter sp. Y32M11 TaxID=2853258 RepID=UPI001C52FC0C|nr:SGNH/GDSL hydrolase family protein [Paeniglutamicibacter sp. Y32M11]QXQ11942.1 SGNH/GDSL hydrolase family protein [Paeniglutamicibacter sp. Y32M11]